MTLLIALLLEHQMGIDYFAVTAATVVLWLFHIGVRR